MQLHWLLEWCWVGCVMMCLAEVVGVMLDWTCDDNCLSMNDVEHDKTLVIMSFMM